MWVPHDTRDGVVDFIGYWSRRTGIYISRFIRWIGISSSTFYDWRERYGKVKMHNRWIPRDQWQEPWEKEMIIEFFLSHLDGRY